MLFAKSKLGDIISECESHNNLFEDLDFPASSSSLSLYKTLLVGNVVWLRPKDIIGQDDVTSDHFYFVNRDTLISFQKGAFGSSELVGAMAILSQYPELFHNIIDLKDLCSELEDKPSISKCCKYGVFSFKFWHNGVWKEVVIDDRLPTDGSGKLIFISSDGCNFLPSLLEKAYAKLLGSYESISRCTLPEILHHLTGGVVESFDMNGSPPPSVPFLTNTFFRALESHSPIGCLVNISHKDVGIKLSNGLITCHQYIVNDIREIKLVLEKGEIPLTLVRLKNPWGKMEQWKGSWNVESPEWRELPIEDKERMGLCLNSDDEFWMDFREFMRLYDIIDICNMPSHSSLSSLSSSSSSSTPPLSPMDICSSKWHCQLFQGKWKNGSSAGGRPVRRDTHWTNPQYRLSIKDNNHDGSHSCVCIVELEQKDELATHGEERNDIGYVIYKCPGGAPFPLSKSFFDDNNFVARCDFFTNLRFVVKRFILEPGVYVVVPSTYEAGVEGSFVLRILTSTASRVESADEVRNSPPRSSIASQHLESVKDPKEEAIEKHFLEFASGDQQISLQQMRLILNKDLKLENQAKDFSLGLCKHLVSLIDKNCKTRVDLREMLYLWNVVKSWRKAFLTHDKYKQGWVNSHELKSIILSMGYKFTPLVLNQLTYRYSNDHHSIELESFITCMVRILNLHDIFKSREKNEKMTCTLDEWLELSLSIL